MRFPKTARLRHASEFLAARHRGRSQHGRLLVLNVLKSSDAHSLARLGIITSRRVGPAVKRNRLRRLVREIFRKHGARWQPGCWQVVVLRPKAAAEPLAALEEEWLRLAAQASILAEPC